MSQIDDFREYVEDFNMVPNTEEMPRRTLKDKGIYGPTSAHVIEEIHTPFNLHYVTITTGTTAFQNIVGVTKHEIDDRIVASSKALELAGVKKGQKILFTYPPLVNVFSKEALIENEIEWSFLERSSRDHLILAMHDFKPDAVIGESTFLKATLQDAKKANLIEFIPKNMSFITAGTPLDTELIEVAKEYVDGHVHDLYGCQEFGWLTIDGIPLREDIVLVPTDKDGYCDLVVGGLSTGDRFPIDEKNGHICNKDGKVITYGRVRTSPEYETIIMETTALNAETVDRLTRTILRIKGKIVRVSPELKVGSDKNVLCLKHYGSDKSYLIEQDKGTKLFDSLLDAQFDYQSQKKNDPTWVKRS